MYVVMKCSVTTATMIWFHNYIMAVPSSFFNQRPSLAELLEHVNVSTKWRRVGIQLELGPKTFGCY